MLQHNKRAHARRRPLRQIVGQPLHERWLEAGKRLVQNEHLRIAQQGAGKAYPPQLASGKAAAVAVKRRIETACTAVNDIINAGACERGADGAVVRGRLRQPKLVAHAAWQESRKLRAHRNVREDDGRPDALEVAARVGEPAGAKWL